MNIFYPVLNITRFIWLNITYETKNSERLNDAIFLVDDGAFLFST